MISLILTFLQDTINLWVEISPYLLLGMFVAGLLHVFLGKEFISSHLGKGGIRSVIKATLLGVPLPVCSCGVIPVVSSLEKDGAHKSSMLAFLVSTPTTGVDSVLATYSLLGPLFAIFRPLGALLAGISLGSLDYLVEGKNEKKKIIPKHKHHKIHISFKWRELIRYSFFEIPQDIGKSLFLGVILGGAISAFIPTSLFSSYFMPPFDFIAALLIGIPLYVCATGSIPVAASLLAKGFSPGAGLVFLIAGPATNAITLSFVKTKMGQKSFYLYLISIITVSLTLGVIFNYVWGALGSSPQLVTGMGKMLPINTKIGASIILLSLTLNALFRKKACAVSMKSDFVINVPDIHCRHCKIALEGKLKEVNGVQEVVVDIKEKTVNIRGSAKIEEVLKKIEETGYNPIKL